MKSIKCMFGFHDLETVTQSSIEEIYNNIIQQGFEEPYIIKCDSETILEVKKCKRCLKIIDEITPQIEKIKQDVENIRVRHILQNKSEEYDV